MVDARGVECLWGDLKNHPQCPHGPTLLFGRYVDDELEKFYACSACRDRKLCKFYLKYGEKLSKPQRDMWEQEKKKLTQRYPIQKLYLRLNEIEAESPANRCYCHNCEKLIHASEKEKHTDHEIAENLTDYQLHHPTELLKPLDNAKKEAQYLFSKKSTKNITDMLLKLGAKQILCIGTPRIHEYITEHYADRMSSLLLDFDGRFHNFFGPLEYCWYNFFNHHFFNKDAINVFKDFITQNKGKDTYLICDPPFGGRVEPMSHTIKTISDLHRKLNGTADNSDDDDSSLKIMFMFPYFMEHVMKKKSNPQSVAGGLKDLKMSDYKVDYDNHPLFASREQSKKQGSPVRLFTNIPLKLLELPTSDGYKFCKKCEKWVSPENKHCELCKECTSKDGRTYKHCETCERCVKPTWKHCETCKRCALEKHTCGQVPNIVGKCFKCNELGHTAKDCLGLSFAKITNGTDAKKTKPIKKRKAENESKTLPIKKGKVQEHSRKIVKQKVRRSDKKTKLVKKRKAENESETPPIKKSKVEHSQNIVKQKIHRSDKKKVLKLRTNKTTKRKQRK